MNQPKRPTVDEELYAELAKAELKLQNAVLDPRHGEDIEFTSNKLTQDVHH